MKAFGIIKKKKKQRNQEVTEESSSAYGHGDEGTNAINIHSSRFDANLDLGGNVPSEGDDYEAQ